MDKVLEINQERMLTVTKAIFTLVGKSAFLPRHWVVEFSNGNSSVFPEDYIKEYSKVRARRANQSELMAV